MNRKDCMGAHEWCYYGWREGAAHQFFGPNNVTDLWAVKKVHHQSMLHLTEKPVEADRQQRQQAAELAGQGATGHGEGSAGRGWVHGSRG
jgi:hypothetical protein